MPGKYIDRGEEKPKYKLTTTTTKPLSPNKLGRLELKPSRNNQGSGT